MVALVLMFVVHHVERSQMTETPFTGSKTESNNRAKWICKYCGATGELELPINAPDALDQICKSSHRVKLCPCVDTSNYLLLVMETGLGDVFQPNGQITRAENTDMMFYVLVVQ
jgi:hypothetical protein